ncbi:MAG: hypothetical protein QOG06_936, partial [Gaiellaceae bacterium]|nr:hypothetical protein [Gaiellaceae bacterium]
MRRLPRRAATLGILLMVVAIGALLAAPARAKGSAEGSGGVTVIQVNGYLDPIEVDFIERSIASA